MIGNSYRIGTWAPVPFFSWKKKLTRNIAAFLFCSLENLKLL